MIFILCVMNFTLPAIPFKIMMVGLFDKMFTLFIVPYWVYAFIKKDSAIPFWSFIKINVNPLIINYIKVFFIVLCSPLFGLSALIKSSIHVLKGNLSIQKLFHAILFLILLIPVSNLFLQDSFLNIPNYYYLIFAAVLGFFSMIKTTIEYFFITSSSLFIDDKHKAIKEAHRLGEGFLLFIFLFFILVFPVALSLINFIINNILFFLPSSNPVTGSLKDGIIYTVTFYSQSFIYIFATHFYFLMKDKKA